MKTVMLVDDEPDVVAVYSMLLDLSGYAVLTAQHGREALAVLAADRPDVIVTDWMMPVMDGHDLCQALRVGGSALAHIPIIVASAAMDAPLGKQRLYDVFLRKPITFDDLIAAIETIVPSTS